MEGFIFLHRKLMKHPKYRDPKFMHLWVHMLLKATHSGISVDFKGETINLDPGQFISGRNQLASETGLTPQNVRTIVERLKIDQQINQLKSGKGSVFTVINWHQYQKPTNKSTNLQPTSNQPPTNHQPLNNKVNNEDKVNNNSYTEDFENNWIEIKSLNPDYNKKGSCFKVWKKLIKKFTSEEILGYYRSIQIDGKKFGFFERNMDKGNIQDWLDERCEKEILPTAEEQENLEALRAIGAI